MSKIFISYRRDDSPYASTAVYDRLVRSFGSNNLFKDVDTIPLGVNFKNYINKVISQCEIVLVLIGPLWLKVTDSEGLRRLFQPNDLVRLEIESAIEREIPIIPLLLSGVRMPTPKELPESISSLPFFQGMSLRPGPDMENDLNRLISSIRSILGQSEVLDAEKSKEPTPEMPSGLVNNVTSHTVISNAMELVAKDVSLKRVLCPLCSAHIFQKWPFGWDAHAAHSCNGLLEVESQYRIQEFKNRLAFLFQPKFGLHALRTTGTVDDKTVQPMLFRELKEGNARFGWSFRADLDLRHLSKQEPFTEEQRDILKKVRFLLDLKPGDYLIYINLPEQNLCSVGKVVGNYTYDAGLFLPAFDFAEDNRDFRHVIPVQFMGTFSRQDPRIPSALANKLKLRGSKWQVKEKMEFLEVLRLLITQK